MTLFNLSSVLLPAEMKPSLRETLMLLLAQNKPYLDPFWMEIRMTATFICYILQPTTIYLLPISCSDTKRLTKLLGSAFLEDHPRKLCVLDQLYKVLELNVMPVLFQIRTWLLQKITWSFRTLKSTTCSWL